MEKTKTTYERPTTDLLVIRFESALLQASLNGFSTQGTENLGYDPEEDL